MRTIRMSLSVVGLLVCGLGLPQMSYGITGCTNAYLSGTYNAQISSLNFLNVVNNLNVAGGTGTDGGTSGSATAPNFGGFGNNPGSLSGRTPGMGRYYFDGNGNIVGLSATAGNSNVSLGSYSVNSDCSATLRLSSGETFNAVLSDGGARVLILQTNANGNGALGQLVRSTNACLGNNDFPQSFAFSFFGGQTVTSTGTGGTGTGTGGTGTGTGGTGTGTGGTGTGTGGTGTGTGGTGTTTTTTQVMPYSAIGSIALSNEGTFSMRQWSFQNGAARTSDSTGTYTVGTDCSLRLSFVRGTQTGGGTFTAPILFRALLVDRGSGLVSVQTDQSTVATGEFIAQ